MNINIEKREELFSLSLTNRTVGRFERERHAVVAGSFVRESQLDGFTEFQTVWSTHH